MPSGDRAANLPVPVDDMSLPAALAQLGSSTSMTTGSNNTVDLATASWLSGGATENLASDSLEVPTSGYYLFALFGEWANSNTGRRDAWLEYALSPYSTWNTFLMDERDGIGSAKFSGMRFSGMTATYRIRMRVSQTSGGNLSLLADSGFGFSWAG